MTDPTLGIPVPPHLRVPPPKHRLVTLGDSLTEGFQSLAISRTDWSWPAMVARALGWSDFRAPTFEGYGGLPFNLEVCLRHVEADFGAVRFWNAGPAAAWLTHYAHTVAHWWIEEANATWAPPPGLNHNLAVHGFDVADSWRKSGTAIAPSLARPAHEWRLLMTPHDTERAAHRMLAHADPGMAVLDVAAAHGRDGGIETLVVGLGANNALGVVLGLELKWGRGEADRDSANVWSPAFFSRDWADLVDRLRGIEAQHVIVATVPHITIAPLVRAVGERLRPSSRYFPYYCYAWMADRFDPTTVKHLTGDEARAIDSAIDQYNATIVESVRQARTAGQDWLVFELGGLLDRLAHRRYLTNEPSQPSWWDAAGGAYPLPAALAALRPVPDTRFFLSDPSGRTEGGLFALDGVHPTTIGYAIVAQEVARLMQSAGVAFPGGQGAVEIDFAEAVAQDSLISHPPRTLTPDLRALGWICEKVDAIEAMLRHPPAV